MHLAELALIGATVWAARAYLWPFTQCRKCKGKKTNPGSTRRRFGSCKRCGGSGSRQVLGSKTIHRAVQSIITRRSKEN